MPIEPADFGQFFWELHQKKPFPWQIEMANQVCGEGWPDVVDLPTASGKTACIDIALFALACQKSAPRRIFFVVDRRVVVNEAYERMKRIAKNLSLARDGVLGLVAERLRKLAGGGDVDPVETCELRGGIYRDESWVRTPLQPTVVASTVDQVGSRLLFRGYGVSESVWPIHAGLIANDSLILLDEAHCSRAFAETLRAIRRYRDWATEPVRAEFRSVEMTATPSANAHPRIFRIGSADKAPEFLGPRIFAPKPTRLVISKNSPKQLDKLAERLCDEALAMAASVEGARRISVMVNRVATARLVFAKLTEAQPDRQVELLIGRMRPIDRDDLMARLGPLKSGEKRSQDDQPRFVVSTQCLEVGADLDFDVLVSECASIDALLQRFGRLNRLGEFANARGCIVIGSGQIEPKQPDPVYGNALKETWRWLNEIAGPGLEINMGIESADGAVPTVAQTFELMEKDQRKKLRMASPAAPVLLPAHLDAWAQTNPQPHCEPLVELFLHGPNRGEPDVQVVWRADLDGFKRGSWADVVSLCPPVAAEAMPVPISAFRRWFANQEADTAASDLEGADAPSDAPKDETGRDWVLIWRGPKSELVRSANDIKPGNTIVLPASAGGVDELGHKPKGAEIDCGDIARLTSQRRLVLRLHSSLIEKWPQNASRERIQEVLSKGDAEMDEILDALSGYRDATPEAPPWLGKLLQSDFTPNRFLRPVTYPGGKGWVLSRKGIVSSSEEDGGNDETSRTTAVLLDRHLQDVEEAVGRYRDLLGDKTAEYQWTAKFHDYGKADIRFQALLRNGDRMAARFAPKPLAKSGSFAMSPQERRRQRERSGLPDGFRHEMLSLVFAAEAAERDGETRDLALHLIASHHGYARPFAPVVTDEKPGLVSFNGQTIFCETRSQRAAHRLDSGVADRFWALTRRFGWWGLAWYEGLFRLADWDASARETREEGAS